MLKFDNGMLTYELSLIEKVGALNASPKASVLNLKSVEYQENPWTDKVLRGIRAPGTGLPYLIMLGTMRHGGGKDFCVIYKRRPVLVLEFEGETFSRWVIPSNEANLKVLESLKLTNADLSQIRASK